MKSKVLEHTHADSTSREVDLPRVSPRLGVHFDMSGEELTVFRPDGCAFLTYREMITGVRVQQQREVDEQARTEKLAARLQELGEDPDEL